MKKYYSELNIQDDGNVAIATVTADNNEQVTFKVVNAKTVYAVDNTENDRNCIYHLLTNEAGKYMPFYQRPGFCAETETIQIEENFDDFEILSSRCACGYKKDENKEQDNQETSISQNDDFFEILLYILQNICNFGRIFAK